MWRRAAFAVLLSLAAAPGPALAQGCEAAIERVERGSGLPPKLLLAIARTESGRLLDGRFVVWPWAINAAGTGQYHETEAAAIAAIEAFRATGVASIDVGCMQVNLLHHSAAFANLQQAFDPVANVAYAARFLMTLRAELGDWPQAVAAYHSRTPDLGAAYGRRVMAAWPNAASYGGAASFATTSAPVVDPYGVYTPEFARRVAADAALRSARAGRSTAEPTALRRPSGDLARRFASQLVRNRPVESRVRTAQLLRRP